jgi:hypothetical protein
VGTDLHSRGCDVWRGERRVAAGTEDVRASAQGNVFASLSNSDTDQQ